MATDSGGGSEADAVFASLVDLVSLREMAADAAAGVHVLEALFHRGNDTDRVRVMRHANVTAELLTLGLGSDLDVRIAAATHSLTPADALAGAVRDRATRVLAAIAANPSTPVETRDLLAQHKSEAVREAAQEGELSPAVIDALVRSTSESDHARIARRSDLTDKQKVRLAKSPSSEARQLIAEGTSDPSVMLLIIEAERTIRSWDRLHGWIGLQSYDSAAGAILDNPAVTEDVVVACVQSPAQTHRISAVVRAHRWRSELFEVLIDDDAAEVRAALARYSIHHETLQRLAGDSLKEVRVVVVENVNCPTVALEAMLTDRVEGIQFAALKTLIGRDAVTPDLAVRAANSKFKSVRDLAWGTGLVPSNTAAAPLAPPQPPPTNPTDHSRVDWWAQELVWMRHLATTFDAKPRDQRHALAIFERTAIHTSIRSLEANVTDAEREARHLALDRFPAACQTLAKNKSVKTRVRVAVHRNCPQPIVEQLANDPKPDVRKAIVEHQTLTPELVLQLANDPKADVRIAIVEQQTLTPELTQQLANDPSYWVRVHVAERQTLTPELIQQLANDPEKYVRSAVARHPDLTPELIQQLANDPEHWVRGAVAQHQTLTPELAQQLANDPEYWVRRALGARREPLP